ncbi:MAG: helix-turn-helix domain-containing protein [Schwartzia sp.]|nr:helix-turn-helix domain-containing protein [Schwartzia sp. (in: firmicutes)]
MKGKRLSKDERLRVVEAYKGGAGATTLAREYGVSRWTVYRLVERYEKTGSVETGWKNSGRKPGLTKAQLAAIEKILTKNPSARMKDIHDTLNLPCTLRALYYIVKKMGIARANTIREPKKKNALPVWKGRAYLW